MKTSLIIYPDESCLEIRKNSRQTHYDMSIISFFDRLRAEKTEKLLFLKTDSKKLHESVLDRFDHLRLDMIITYSACSEIEHYAEERDILYFVFDHFSKNSTYLDRFWLFNRNIIADFEKIADKYHFMPGTLSALSNQAAFYGMFSPLPHKSTNFFYHKDKTRLLFLIDDSYLAKDANTLIVQIKNALNDIPHLFGKEAELVLYGRSKKLLAKLAASLNEEQAFTVYVVHDHFRFSENCVYSMIHKSDIVLSCKSSIGVDAIVLKKPTIFIGADNLLSKKLNSLVTDFSDGSELHRIGQGQHEYLSRFVSFLERNYLFFPNVSCNSDKFHKSLVNVVLSQNNKGHQLDGVRSGLSNEKQRENAIVSEYVDGPLKAKRLFFSYLRKKKIEEKKFAKLQNDPRAFFRDSKFLPFRLIGSYLCNQK
jgi:hypothetical protein